MNSGYILDPLSVIIVLATNAYRPIGTKLSISHGRIILQNNSMLQGTIRSYYGDSKNNVKHLYHPILYACKYIFARIHNKENLEPAFEHEYELLYLFTKAKLGLENIIHTYREDTEIRTVVNTYVNVIQSTIDANKHSFEFLDMLLRIKNSECEPECTEEARKHIVEELYKFWDANRICIVIGLIKELETATPYGKSQLFNAIDSFMEYVYDKTKLLTIVASI
jgi:hypothetical protein